MPSALAVLLVLVLLAALIGGGLVWHEERFYGRLRFQEKPPSLRDTYRARLVQVLRRIDERPGSRVSFTPRALLELEGGEDRPDSAGEGQPR